MSRVKWATILTGAICVLLALWGALIYPLSGWGILEVLAYEFILLLLLYGVFRLVYNRAILDQN
ncbi:hypothetical protein EU546_00235 [Candidatus Thorarchaeota archaeon]|nr:MAG: hypothetical protein EU546_00235 [Candidatus Thorarchaeota archaeon]